MEMHKCDYCGTEIERNIPIKISIDYNGDDYMIDVLGEICSFECAIKYLTEKQKKN